MTLPDGFTYMPRALADLDLDAFEALDWAQEELTMYGKTFDLPRLTCMYGAAYTYSGVHHRARPMPGLLDAVRARVEAVSGLDGFNSVLGNLYRDGSHTVGWHSDDETTHTRPQIASVSLGATRRFRIRSKADKSLTWALELAHGDVLLMTGRSQLDYMHSVPRTTRKVGTRINFTFRSMENPREGA
jgi:alkylated DNA repair dioxygenase AlkB